MLQKINLFLEEQGICLHGALLLSDCKITRPHLLERLDFEAHSVVIFAIPYYSQACDKPHNLSAYAIAEDYHKFVRHIEALLIDTLAKDFPSLHFTVFADHSPIDEREAAARASLGKIGKNGLLITEPYSSYVFLGEIFTDAILPTTATDPKFCEACGVCLTACPLQNGASELCLSALTQKKGVLSENEKKVLIQYGSVWGCDICSEVCPHTKKAKKSGSIYSPIPFFHQKTLPQLTSSSLSAMSEKDFSARAYSWRGRETILRNINIVEEAHERDGQKKEQISTE